MLSLAGAPLAFAPAVAPLPASRAAVRSTAPQMAEDAASRRQLMARGAALFGLAAAQSASAKSGEFGKISIFDLVGTPAISSPYQEGGPQAGPDSTFGYKKTGGEFLAKDYQSEVGRERAAFKVSSDIVSSQKGNIDSKTWWLVRDNLRGQAYNMKANMQALNAVAPDTAAANKAYKTFWNEINALDLACQKKELALAQKEYDDVLAALAAYSKTV